MKVKKKMQIASLFTSKFEFHRACEVRFSAANDETTRASSEKNPLHPNASAAAYMFLSGAAVAEPRLQPSRDPNRAATATEPRPRGSG
jgi:hypothetical protein